MPSAVAARLDAELAIRELESPSLPRFVGPSAEQAIAELDGKLAKLTADELIRLAVAHEQVEGASAYVASTSLGSKQGLKVVRRDDSVDRSIEVRRSFLARFDADPRRDDQRVALARALLRRAVYRGATKDSDLDRVESRRWIEAVASASSAVQPSASTSATRDACYMLAE
ncbi:MAG: hypothetical protein ACHREM_29355, partial [Polyangiales bacterium]